MLKKRLKKRIKRRISSSGSTTELDDEQAKKAVKKRRMVINSKKCCKCSFFLTFDIFIFQVKKRVHGYFNQDSSCDKTRNLERLEDKKISLEQQEFRDTLPIAPLISVRTQPEKITDPLEFDQPLDLSIPKMICVSDSKYEIILIDSEDDVKPTLEGIFN